MGTTVRKAMAYRKVTVPQLASMVGLSASYAYKVRAGRAVLALDTARAISEALDWPSIIEMVVQQRTRACDYCGGSFVDSSRSSNRLYCTQRCQSIGSYRRLHGTVERERRAQADRLRLSEHQAAVAAMCQTCEPEGRCRDAECPLRAVSPLTLRRRAVA